MNWKTEAIEKLREYEAKKQATISIPEQIAILKSASTGIRSATADGTPVKGGGSGREDMLLNNIIERDKLRSNLAGTVRWIKCVEGGLSVLSEEERLILDKFYIHPVPGAADYLASVLHLDIKTVYKRKDAAVRKFTVAMYGITEE